MTIDSLPITIRMAESTDTTTIANLMSQLGYPLSLSDMEQIITKYLTTEQYAIFVAIANGQLIGATSVIIIDHFHQIGKAAILSSLVIDAEYRGRGVGSVLMDFVEDHAKCNSCISVELKSGVRRIKDGTHNFYKKRGYIDNATNQTYFKKNLW